MESRETLARNEHLASEEYQEYYTNHATLNQAIIYIAYGLRPMDERWHRIKRKTPIYNIQKSKENKILTAKERLLTILSKGELIAYGNKGIGIPQSDQGIDEFWRVRHILCYEHESEYLAIPADFLGSSLYSS